MADNLVALNGGRLPRRHQAAARRLKELEAQFRLARDPRERALIADVLVPEYITRGETALADGTLCRVELTEDIEVDARIAALRAIVATMSGDDPGNELAPALDALSMLPDGTAAVVRHRAGVAYFLARKPYEAEEYSLQALWLCDATGNRWLAARTASVLYVVHYHLTGDLQAARYYSEVLGVEAVAANDREVRRVSLLQQYDFAATFAEWDRAVSLRSLLRREPSTDSYGNDFTMRVSDCLVHGHLGDFAAMRGIADMLLAGATETADLALGHALKSLALSALAFDDEARREARRALGLARVKSGPSEPAFRTIRSRLAAVLASYVCILIGDVIRGMRALKTREKWSGAIGMLAHHLSNAALHNSELDLDDPALQSIKGYASVASAARLARDRLRRVDSDVVNTLTDTELMLLRSAASGKSNSEIAKERGVTRSAVERRLMSAYSKLGVRNRAEAIEKLHTAKT